MKKVFVFCVGGTGLRVMKSVTMLMAAGMDTNGYTVVPVKVDPHRDLGERKGLNVIIEDYNKIYKGSVCNGNEILNPMKGFFSSAIDYQLDSEVALGGEEKRFGEYINANLPDDDVNKYFVQTLYSQKSLDSKLTVGFKGNPNVGTVVLGDMIEGKKWFDKFKDSYNEGDRIFIVSSIFGGTGASGYPIIEKKIREAKEYTELSKALMGAVTVLPYYALDDPSATNSDIDSTSFLTKAKSALAYYENTVLSDYLYYVGEKSENWTTYENNESEQKDKAHFVELVAASALFDFLTKEKPETTRYLSRAIKIDNPSLDRISLGDGYNDIIRCIANFMLLRIIVKTLPSEKYFPLKKRCGMDDKFYNSDEYVTLKNFIEMFKNWYDELATNKRAFAPLNVDKEKQLATWIKGMSLGLNNDSDILLEMINAYHRENINHTNRLRYLLSFAYTAINKFTKDLK